MADVDTTDTDGPVADGPDDSTRERLIRAAVAIAMEEGVGAVTTVSVCRRVGIAQSSYYTHFASRDELLSAIGERSAAATRRATRQARLRFGENRDQEHLRATVRAPLELIRSNPELFRLGLRARHEPETTPLGAHGRAVADLNRDELADDLMAMARQDDPDLRRRYEMVADCIAAMVSTLGEGHVEGRYPDMEEVVDLLAIYTAGSSRLVEWLGWQRPGRPG